ncbi:hypothetical protein [Sediminicoccus sp. BL-A-41-H5]|uniref:hypothetical protein n=1 Tax=Sediminicoccus sp. BL-A-41-H5 TaxID=3421106 RepID=UPI003D6700B2
MMRKKTQTPEEIGAKLRQAEVLIENQHRHDNRVRPHSALAWVAWTNWRLEDSHRASGVIPG